MLLQSAKRTHDEMTGGKGSANPSKRHAVKATNHIDDTSANLEVDTFDDDDDTSEVCVPKVQVVRLTGRPTESEYQGLPEYPTLRKTIQEFMIAVLCVQGFPSVEEKQAWTFEFWDYACEDRGELLPLTSRLIKLVSFLLATSLFN